MRIIHWLFAISAALFISGIGFIVAGARAAPREAAAVAQAPPMPPVATVKQIMDGIVAPAATVVFDSVGTIVDATGIHEKAPSTETEWAVLGANAAALVESANLLMIGNRAIDQQDWAKMSKALADAGMLVLKAAEAKSAEGILGAGETLNASCDACHQRYQRE